MRRHPSPMLVVICMCVQLKNHKVDYVQLNSHYVVIGMDG